MLYSKVENLLIINYIQVLFCIITIAFEIVYDSSIIKAKRETKELIDKKYNKKIVTDMTLYFGWVPHPFLSVISVTNCHKNIKKRPI